MVGGVLGEVSFSLLQFFLAVPTKELSLGWKMSMVVTRSP